MVAIQRFINVLTDAERRAISELDTPFKIQSFLDKLSYSTESVYRCPLRVIRDGIAHCFDGAVFAAAALQRIGDLPLILDMIPDSRDDDHVLALYKRDSHWGAVAKSNYVGLRFREPIFRNLRELVVSYFEQYYNVEGEKTLRGYTIPLNLKIFDKISWMTNNEAMDQIARQLDKICRFFLMTPKMVSALSPVDDRSFKAGLLGANEGGLFKPS